MKTRPPSIPYRETITRPAEGHHRHKKQTGGAGQFGEVYLRIEPLARGTGFEFVDDVVGGAIPNQFIPAVEKGIRHALAEGAVAGFPLQDIRVSVYDGKYHSVDSKEVAFVSAGRKAFLDAVQKAAPAVLEPIVHVEINAPGTVMGDITADLATRRARIDGNEARARGPHRRVGLRAARGSHGLPEPVEGADRRRREFHLAAQPLRPGPAAQAAGTRIRLEARGGRGMNADAPLRHPHHGRVLRLRERRARRARREDPDLRHPQGARAAAAQGQHRRQEGLLQLGALPGLQARRCTRRRSS